MINEEILMIAINTIDLYSWEDLLKPDISLVSYNNKLYIILMDSTKNNPLPFIYKINSDKLNHLRYKENLAIIDYFTSYDGVYEFINKGLYLNILKNGELIYKKKYIDD